MCLWLVQRMEASSSVHYRWLLPLEMPTSVRDTILHNNCDQFTCTRMLRMNSDVYRLDPRPIFFRYAVGCVFLSDLTVFLISSLGSS